MNLPTMGMIVPIMGMLTGCSVMNDVLGASTPEKDVTVSLEDFTEHWRQLERRWPVFFAAQCVDMEPLPNMLDIRDRVKFVEVPKEYLATCTYRRSNKEIRIGDDKWTSGCVAHELGHAACHYLDRDDCFDFEHPNYRSRCEG